MKKGYTIIQMVGAVLLLVGAMLQITRWELSPILYTVGAVMFAYVQVMSRYEGKNLIVRRLRRQQILGAVLLVFAGVLMFVTPHFSKRLTLLFYSLFPQQEEPRADCTGLVFISWG